MVTMAYRIKLLPWLIGLRSGGATIETKNFAFKTKAQLGFESTHPDVLVAKIGLNGSDN